MKTLILQNQNYDSIRGIRHGEVKGDSDISPKAFWWKINGSCLKFKSKEKGI